MQYNCKGIKKNITICTCRAKKNTSEKWTIQIRWQQRKGEEKQNKNTTQYVLDTTIGKQVQKRITLKYMK